MSPRRVLLMLMRLAVVFQLVVGTGIWTGHWLQLTTAHIRGGIFYVLLFWALAIIALVQRRSVGLALFAIAWGVVIAGLGMTQGGILVGDLHWIVRLLHLIIGVSAMPIAERLAPRPLPAAPGPA